MHLELPAALVLQPPRLAIVVAETRDGDVDVAVAVEIAGLGVCDPGDPIGDDVRREMLMTVVLQDDHGSRAVVAGHQHAEGSDHQVEVAVAVDINRRDVGRRVNRGQNRLGERPARGLPDPAHAVTEGVADQHVRKAVLVEVGNLHVRDARPFPGRGAVSNWRRIKEPRRRTVRQHRRGSRGLPVAGAAAAGDQPCADQQGERRRPVGTTTPHGHSGGAGIIVQNGAREAISGGDVVEGGVDRQPDVGRDTIGCERAVDDAEGGAFAIEVDERPGRPRVDPQPVERDGILVVGTRLEGAAAVAGRRVSIERICVCAAALADQAPAQAPDQFLLRHDDFDDDDGSAVLHDDVEREALVHRSGKAVQDESVLRIGQDDALRQDFDHHFVVDELPAVHQERHRAPERRGGERGSPEHVAGGDDGHTPGVGDACGLRAFSGPGRAHEDEIHGRNVNGR